MLDHQLFDGMYFLRERLGILLRPEKGAETRDVHLQVLDAAGQVEARRQANLELRSKCNINDRSYYPGVQRVHYL